MSRDINNSFESKSAAGRREIFCQIKKIAKQYLVAGLNNTLTSTDDFLYEICQQDQSTYGSPNIENLKVFRSAMPKIEPAYVRALEGVFNTFETIINAQNTEALGLSLIDIDEMEDVVSAELISEALVRHSGEPIDFVGQRLFALWELNAANKSSNPLSARHITDLLRTTLSELELSAKIRALLYRYYEQELLKAVPELMEALNELLLAANILPNLKSLNAVKPQRSVKPKAETVIDKAPAPKDSPPKNSAPQASESADMPMNASDRALFDELCNRLHSWRPAYEPLPSFIPGAVGAAPVARPMATSEMISVLSLLQSSVPDSLARAIKSTDASISSSLKTEMFNNARKMGLPPESVQMQRDDEDAVDLVGMLFDVLMTERDFEDDAKSLISRLLVPYVKAAVMDRRLFLTKAHPARRLLNVLTEAVEGNHGDGPQERELLNKAGSMVDRLVMEFNEDIAIFETLEQELRAYMDQHRRRIDIAERRATEAQRGQERLEQARYMAAQELEKRTRHIELPSVVQDFFSRCWTHHLSMVALREGSDSASWTSALNVADEVIAFMHHVSPNTREALILSKRSALESILASSGILGEAAQSIITKMAASSLHYAVDSDSMQRHVDAAQTHDSVSSKTPFNLRLVSNKEKLDFDSIDAEFFKTIPIGTWLQLEGSDGKFAPIKMAWISPISSRLMFVNRRGVRVLVVSVEELAQMKKQGKLIVHEQENVFEQTMDRVLNRLRNDSA